MEIENFLITWVPIFVIMSIITIGLLEYAKIRSTYKVAQV